jgi:hypothetical protein
MRAFLGNPFAARTGNIDLVPLLTQNLDQTRQVRIVFNVAFGMNQQDSAGLCLRCCFFAGLSIWF